jgi:alpha-tubulin suppressor-like RCC1 family protein
LLLLFDLLADTYNFKQNLSTIRIEQLIELLKASNYLDIKYDGSDFMKTIGTELTKRYSSKETCLKEIASLVDDQYLLEYIKKFFRSLYTFGYGKCGQLGYGYTKKQLKPKMVEGIYNVTYVTCGSRHTTLIVDGELYIFSSEYFAQNKAQKELFECCLGRGAAKERNEQSIPTTKIAGLNNVTYVSCGDSHTAVIANGALYTFGNGHGGRLGHGDEKNQFIPMKVEGLYNVTYVSCGEHSTAVIANGALYTFGNGYEGRLGHGDEDNQLRPKKVKGLNNITCVSCGYSNTAVIANGALYTFGHIYFRHDYGEVQLRPTKVEDLNNVTHVSCGYDHIAVIANSELYTFGNRYNNKYNGRLGYDNDNDDNQLRPKKVEGLNNVTYVFCGGYHIAVIANGELYTFGYGKYGQLGHGDQENQLRPKKVEGINNATYISCGIFHTAVIAD